MSSRMPSSRGANDFLTVNAYHDDVIGTSTQNTVHKLKFWWPPLCWRRVPMFLLHCVASWVRSLVAPLLVSVVEIISYERKYV
jgi:hypothetical protein